MTANVIKDYLRRKLNRDGIECFLLLRKGTDPRTRTSLSFKARVPLSCLYITLDPTFWPYGITARPFVARKDF